MRMRRRYWRIKVTAVHRTWRRRLKNLFAEPRYVDMSILNSSDLRFERRRFQKRFGLRRATPNKLSTRLGLHGGGTVTNGFRTPAWSGAAGRRRKSGEAYRTEDPNRARLLIGVTIRTLTVDSVRAWEIMEEAVKAANNSEKFSGENVELYFPFATKSGLKIVSIGGADYGLTGVLKSLARDDLYRSIDVAKGFKNDGPRAMAVLAVRSPLLQKTTMAIR